MALAAAIAKHGAACVCRNCRVERIGENAVSPILLLFWRTQQVYNFVNRSLLESHKRKRFTMKPIYTLAFGLILFAMPAPADAAEKVAVDQAAPDITVVGVDGKKFKMSDIAKRGKNTALMFSRANW